MKRISLLVLISVCPAALWAAPTISNVTGTFEDAGSVTITGTGYGTKSPAAPLRWAPFNTNSQASSLGVATTWNQIQNLVWDADEGYGSTPGLKGTAISGDGALGTLRVDSSSPYWNAANQKFYRFYREKKNFIAYDHDNITGDDHNFKTWRIWPSGSSGYPNATVGDYAGRIFVEQTGCAGDSGGWTGKPISNSTSWVAKEMFFEASSASCVKDGSLRERHNGVDKYTKAITTQKDSPTVNWQSHFVVHAVAANVGSKWTDPAWTSALNMWVDDVYVDTTWQRVMIGDKPNFADCRKLGFVIPSAWSATSITGTLQFPAGDFPDGATAYVFAFDTSNDTNTGYAIEISGEAQGNPAPELTSVNPSTASYLGGTVSTATGTGFLSGLTVLVGTQAATGVTLVNSTTVRFTIPSGQPGLTGLDLKITNSDEQFSVLGSTMSYDEPVANLPPFNVSAGDDREVTLPATVKFSGSAEDDGLPVSPGALTYLWAKQSGPGTITFDDSTSLTPVGTFSSSGTYTVSITADDGDLSTESDVVTVTVFEASGSILGWTIPD
jgi:hypothetical protein